MVARGGHVVVSGTTRRWSSRHRLPGALTALASGHSSAVGPCWSLLVPVGPCALTGFWPLANGARPCVCRLSAAAPIFTDFGPTTKILLLDPIDKWSSSARRCAAWDTDGLHPAGHRHA